MFSNTLNETLTTHEFYVLLALTGKTLHGYGIRSQIASDSDSSLVLAPATMYPLLHRLEGKFLIAGSPSDRPGTTTSYRLTPLGRQRLQAETQRLERVVTHAHLKLGRKLGRPAA